jgi:hypothetical protein
MPTWFSRRTIVSAVDKLVACGLLQEWRTNPSPSAKYRSRLRATPKLIESIGQVHVSDLVCRETPPVILHCRADRRVLNPFEALNEQKLTELASIARDVEEHNKFLNNV